VNLGTFVFPTAEDPKRDGAVIDEALAEAVASEELGMDAVWLAEHHFDGMCAYVDPIVFAAMLASATKRVQIGFAVVQASLHHPLRLAEQISLLDHLAKGRLIAGLGKGSMFNAYEYEGFEIEADDASARHDEIEEVMLKAWTGEKLVHRGRFWNFEIPMLRPLPFTKPHPHLLRACGGEESTIKHASSGRPYLFAGPTNIIAKRVELVRETMRKQGRDEAYIAHIFERSWVWQHAVVADSDAEGREIAMQAVRDYIAYRDRLGLQSTLADIMRKSIAGGNPPLGYAVGTPETVARELAPVAKLGIGGLIIRFDIGPMSSATSRRSLELFAKEVAPRLRAPALETVK
jgi:alkanesulfonate monooxygenase SsuD/methylene tetrahydromethanopterin reductase-like flavin-dependent oxidoreductase (luciferase family)